VQSAIARKIPIRKLAVDVKRIWICFAQVQLHLSYFWTSSGKIAKLQQLQEALNDRVSKYDLKKKWLKFPKLLEAICSVILTYHIKHCELFEVNFLFHLYPPVTRKRRWRYILDESTPARSCPFSEFSGCVFDYHWICCLFEATKQR